MLILNRPLAQITFDEIDRYVSRYDDKSLISPPRPKPIKYFDKPVIDMRAIIYLHAK